MYFCDIWNSVVSWSNSSTVITNLKGHELSNIHYLETHSPDAVGNRKLDTFNINGVKELIRNIQSGMSNDIYCLAFDQAPGLLQLLFNKEYIRNDISKVFSGLPK